MGKIIDLIKDLILNIFDWFFAPFKELKSFHSLIYGKDGDEDLIYGIFTADEIENIYHPGMNAFVALAVTTILVGIVIYGMRISSAGINPSNRTAVIEFFKDLLIVGLVFFNLPTLYSFIFGINYTVVGLFESEHSVYDLSKIDNFLESFWENGPLGALFIGLFLIGLTIWANFYYMMRKVSLLLLMIMGPLMIALYLIPKTKIITATWLKEIIGNVSVQSIHAALYFIISAMVLENEASVVGILTFAIFIPIAESIRSLIGLSSGMTDRLSKAGAMAGLSTLGAMAGAVRGAIRGESIVSTLNDKFKGIKKAGSPGSTAESDAKSGILNNAGTDIGSTVRGERMLKSGEFFSKQGKAIFGAAGGIAGVPMGPMGTMIGSTIGYDVGGVAGGLAGRLGAAGAQFGYGRLKAGAKTGINAFKSKGIKNPLKSADEQLAQTLASEETTKWANENKEKTLQDWRQNRFPDLSDEALEKMWGKEVSAKRSENLQKARQTVQQLRSSNGSLGKASDLINSTVDKLSGDWAKENKESFMANYDKANPLSANATIEERNAHNQNKKHAWNQALSAKKAEISQAVTNSARSLSHNINDPNSIIDKNEFATAVGSNVSSVIGKGAKETTSAIKNATKSVKGVSLYSGKSVNTGVLANSLAHVKTNQEREAFINNGLENETFSTREQGLQIWNATEGPNAFQRNLKEVSSSLPKHIPLNHSVSSNNLINGAKTIQSTVGAGIAGTIGAVSGTLGLQSIKSVATNNRITHALNTGILGATVGNDKPISIMNGIKETIAGFKYYTPNNAVEKQAKYQHAISYGLGVIGGVRGYKAGATMAAGGANFQNPDGSFAFKYNPFNKHVNRQVAEISEIQQIAQTVELPTGQREIAKGAIRMATSRNETVIQVRDKAGQVHTVSRLGSGDSSLRKGQTIYQDLTLQDGQLVTASHVYKEDSGGGRIALNRQINVNPNRLVSNKTPKTTTSVIKEIQSYSQFVDSGQYYLKDAAKEMANIQMIVERNRSYLVGEKDGQQYRISPFGPGDTRLETNEVVYRECEVKNMNLNVVSDYKQTGSHIDKKFIYNGSMSPNDLIPKRPPNKRYIQRQMIEKERTKAFTEPLR